MKKTLILPLVPMLALIATPASAKSADTSAASKQVDALLAQGWEKHGIKPNPIVNDETFMRRTYLTVIGRVPSYDEAKAFLNSQEKNKRVKLVDQLLASDGYVHHFFNYWADVLRAQSQGVAGSTTAQNYLNYLRQSLAENKPFDKLAMELVSSEGTCFDQGAIGYYMRDRGMPLDNLANTIRIFLGTRMECAQCHDHPFDRWKEKEFYEMAAFTHNMTSGSYQSESQTEVQKMIRQDKTVDDLTRDMMRRAITEVTTPLRDTRVTQNKNSLRLPPEYKYADAKPRDLVQASVMFGKPVTLTKDSNTIQEFGKWLTSKDNPRFTGVLANRLWKKVFGLGLIEPVDELMDNTVASNPELMKFLTQQVMAYNYDMKAYLRMLLTTQAFQRASSPEEVNAANPYYFPGPVFHRMSAEQIWDSIVTLVNPNPDEVNWTQREREKRELDNRRRLASLLDKTEAPLLFEAAKKSADVMREQNKEFDVLRKELDVARAKDDKEKVREIQRRLNESQRIFRETISRCFYEAAKKSGNKEIQAELAAASQSMGGSMEMAVMNMMETPRVDSKEMPMDAADMKEMDAEMVALGIKDAKTKRSYANYRKGLHQSWCRAAQLPSPAPRGHFLREFGQSDREVIENANNEASVPQALTLMNSSLMTQLTNGWSVLASNLRTAGSAEEKIDVVYLSIFGRKAKPAERTLLLQTLDQAGGSTRAWEDIVMAAISTDQFLFIE